MAKDKRSSLVSSALKLAKQGKIEAAIKEYEKIIQFKPDDLEIRRIIGDLHYNRKNLQEAVKQFDWIADFYRREGFHAKAIAMLKRVTKIDPGNEKVSFKLAELYSAQGLTIEAKQIYLELAEEYKRKRNIKSALKMYEKILEFDSGNITMRLLLADNYLKEKMQTEAVREYLTVSDILIRKKEYVRLEDLLAKVIPKVKNEKLMEKLANAYIKQDKTDEAVNFLKGFGEDIYNHLNLLKLLGDLYFDKGLINEAEQIYLKLSSINPEEIEVIMKLGRMYMDRKDFNKTFSLFTPVVDKFVSLKKYEDAISLLRFILTVNDSFAPVREKMADIFRLANKKNSLIQVLESLIPVYEAENKIDEIKKVLEELINLSDSPYEYESRLSALSSGDLNHDASEDISEDDEFMLHNFRKADEAIKISDFAEAESIIKSMKDRFPGNLNVSLKLYALYELTNNTDLQISEGYTILDLYKINNMDEEYSILLDEISKLSPENPITQDLVADERTDIEINFGKSEIQEEVNLSAFDSNSFDVEEASDNSNIFSLTDEDSVIKPAEDVKKEISDAVKENAELDEVDYDEETKHGVEVDQSLDNLINELKHYIKNRLFGEAEQLSARLLKDFPGEEQVVQLVNELDDAKHSLSKEPDPLPNTSSNNIILGNNIDMALEGEITDELDLKASTDVTDDDEISLELEDSSYELEDDNSNSEISLEKESEIVQDEVKVKESGISDGFLSDVFDRNEVIINKSDTKPPFDEANDSNIFEGLDEEELFEGEPILFESDNYYELEEKAKAEIESIVFWLKELERQRTSTIEKNMMEIFEEFKKGVEDKIGQEDYDTRYNLGIAYKEMGLLEEAIHEFLIASKHPLKLFDSAGLLGICFREKGMYSEGITWLKKALGLSGRQDDEYLNIKYELISCYDLSEDMESAKELANEIMGINPDFRDIREIHNKLMRE